jgi:hypothetical protein
MFWDFYQTSRVEFDTPNMWFQDRKDLEFPSSDEVRPLAALANETPAQHQQVFQDLKSQVTDQSSHSLALSYSQTSRSPDESATQTTPPSHASLAADALPPSPPQIQENPAM